MENGYLTFEGVSDDFTLSMYLGLFGGTIEYSTDTINWQQLASDTTVSSANRYLYLRGYNGSGCRFGNYPSPVRDNGREGIIKLSDNTQIKCIGNIENLLDYNKVLNGEHPNLGEACFAYMFAHCKTLIQAPELPSTSLAVYCYHYMFAGSGLIEAPELPATTLVTCCYSGMFQNCKSLIKLPATYLQANCYEYMFYSCTSLKLSTSQSEEYHTPYRIPTSGDGSNNSSSLSSMFYGTSGEFTGTPSINTTYYLHKSCGIVGQGEEDNSSLYQIWKDGVEYGEIWVDGNEYIEAWTLIGGVKTKVWAKNVSSTPTTPGLYDENWNLIVSWEDSGIDNECSNASSKLELYPLTTHIIIKEGITNIYTSAFLDCRNIISVKLPNSLIHISSDAFNNCFSLSSINIPSSVENINEYAFQGCPLDEIELPIGLKVIGRVCFANCGTNNINIPDTVTSIGEMAFLNIPHIEYHGSATGAPWGALSIN